MKTTIRQRTIPLERPWRWRKAALLLLATALGGCNSWGDFKEYSDYAPDRAPEARAVPVAISTAVPFAEGRIVLNGDARDAIDDFLARHRVDRTDDLRVVLPEVPSQSDLNRAERIRAYLAHRQLAVAVVAKRDPAGAPAGREPNRVILSVLRHQVMLPGCPDWTDRGGITHSNRVSSNWGCANAVNLGLMVADPGDLAGGRNPGLGDGEAWSLGIQRYRKGETKPLPSTSTGTVAGPPEQGGAGGGGGQ